MFPNNLIYNLASQIFHKNEDVKKYEVSVVWVN